MNTGSILGYVPGVIHNEDKNGGSIPTNPLFLRSSITNKTISQD
jgi:hypothetical protein